MADWEFELESGVSPEPNSVAEFRGELRRAAADLAEAVELARARAAMLVPIVRGAKAAGMRAEDIATEARISTADVERILAEGRLY
jgi:hypothetical protein